MVTVVALHISYAFECGAFALLLNPWYNVNSPDSPSCKWSYKRLLDLLLLLSFSPCDVAVLSVFMSSWATLPARILSALLRCLELCCRWWRWDCLPMGIRTPTNRVLWPERKKIAGEIQCDFPFNMTVLSCLLYRMNDWVSVVVAY